MRLIISCETLKKLFVIFYLESGFREETDDHVLPNFQWNGVPCSGKINTQRPRSKKLHVRWLFTIAACILLCGNVSHHLVTDLIMQLQISFRISKLI